MKLTASIIIFLLLAGFSSFAQRDVADNASWSLKDRVYIGGGFGLNTGRDPNGNNYFLAQVSPIIGYMITPKLSSGTGINYTYLKFSDLGLSTNQYGINPFLRFNVTQELFAITEYNFISVDPDIFNDNNPRQVFERFLLGAGYTQRLGNRGAVNMMALYDLKFTNTGPFSSPWVFRIFLTL